MPPPKISRLTVDTRVRGRALRLNTEDRTSAPGPSLEQWRHAIEIAAFIVAGLWAFYVFVYEQRLKPLAEPPAVQSDLHVERQPLRHDNLLLTVVDDVKNIGSPSVQMDAAIINIYGIRYGHLPNGRVVRINRNPSFGYIARWQPVIKRSLLVSALFREAPFGGKGRFPLAPGSDGSYWPHTVISNDSYDTVIVETTLCYQRNDNDRTTTFTPRIGRDGAYEIAGLWPLNDPRHGIVCEGSQNREFAL